MKVVLSWLRDLAAIPNDPDAVSTALTSLGMAVDEMVHVGAGVPGVITARVLRTERHPDAAKVHRVYVDAGDGVERHVWCGAFNMQPGDVLPLATLGTRMPDGRDIQRRGILGIDSEGMLCSARELELGDDHGGIMILPSDTPLGVPIMDALGIEPDVVYECDLTRNRPDTWGHVGIARDLAAYFRVPFTPPSRSTEVTGDPRTPPVVIVDGERCGRFTATVMSGVRVTDGPAWMARRLSLAGMRPINNVVDATNYVMLELNQPTHAYDIETLGGGGFRIRLATDGESLATLDGQTRLMTSDDLLICDADDVPVGIAGIMGGLDSEISSATTTVALESAWFEPVGIARRVAHLGLRSEASTRFERGVDPFGPAWAAARIADLLRETCPDLVVHAGMADARGSSCPAEQRSLEVRVQRVNALLGTALDETTMRSLLDPIGYTTSPVSDGVFSAALPSWRPDSTLEVDVIEEIARHYGYDNVGKTVPNSTIHGRLSPVQVRRRQVRELLIGLGISEAMPNPFLTMSDVVALGAGADDVVTLTNPLVDVENVLRPSLRPGLLKALGFNASHRASGLSLFEIGHVYPPNDDPEAPLPGEYEVLGVALAGRDAGAAMAVWRDLSALLGFGARVDQTLVPAGMHPGRSATLTLGKTVAGMVGEIHPDLAEHFGVTERVAYVELHLTLALAHTPSIPKHKPVSRYPSSDIDLAFSMADDIPAEKLERALRQAASKLLVGLELFDVYRGPGVADGARSLAYHVRLQAADHTLTDEEIGTVRSAAIKAADKLGASLRT